MNNTSSPRDTLWDLIKSTRFGMLTHRHTDGMLHSHPLTTQNKSIDEAGILYFFVSKKSEVGERLLVDGNVNVAYVDTGKDTYVSVTGQAKISEDMATKERLFTAISKAWFPAGPADPDMELVEIHIRHAEYWDVKESKMTQLFKIATAAVTGSPPKMGEHKEVNF